MKILLLVLMTFAAIADDNYNNTQTSTQTITHQDTYSTVDNSLDNSVSTDTSQHYDQSTGDFRDNELHINSDNQYSEQTINNTKTVGGDLIDGSFTGNTGTNAGGTVTSSGGNASASNGDVSGQQQQQQKQATSTTVSPSYTSTSVNNVPKSFAMAWSPNVAMSMSQENCNNSVSMGVSGPGIGAISAGVPITDDECNRRRDVIQMMNLGLPRVACYRMAQGEGNSEAMKAAGFSCDSVATISARESVAVGAVAVPPTTQHLQTELNGLAVSDRELQEIYDETFKRYMQK